MASAPASTMIPAAIGVSATIDSRFASDASSFISANCPAAACRLILGMIAVRIETPMIP